MKEFVQKFGLFAFGALFLMIFSVYQANAQVGGFVFQGSVSDVIVNVGAGGVSGTIDSNVQMNVAPRFTGWTLDARIYGTFDSSSVNNITYNTLLSGPVTLPIRYVPDATDQAMQYYYVGSQVNQGSGGTWPIPKNDSVILNNVIDTQQERDYLTIIQASTGQAADPNQLISDINAFIATNPPLTESHKFIDKYELLSPDASNGWYCEGGGLSNGAHNLSGSFNISYTFNPGITYSLTLDERIWGAESQGGINVYGYHDCLRVAADYRLRYDEVIITSGAVCGNGFVEAGEQCDDGNLVDGDGCSSGCAFEGAPPAPVINRPTVQVDSINQCGFNADEVCVLQANVSSNSTNTKYVLFRDEDGDLIGKGTNVEGSLTGVSELVLDECLQEGTHQITAVPYIMS